MDERDDFFVGYASTPRSLVLFLAALSLALVSGAAGMGFALGSRTNDPGGAYFATQLGKQNLTGVVEHKPYPILRVRPDAKNPAPRALMLMAPGKSGVRSSAEPLEAQLVDATGFFFRRGTIDVLQIQGKNGLRAHEGEGAAPFAPAAPEALGRWRVTGEICDGKCLFGAMRPGTGLAHKGCANLCLVSGAPPVLVTTGPVAGSAFLLLADPDGEPLPDAFRDYVAVLVELEGELERRDDLLVFKVDITTAEVL